MPDVHLRPGTDGGGAAPPVGRRSDTGLFPAGAVIRRVTSEPAMYLGAGRALMLQVANPAVGHGVADHSDFRRDPFGRLVGTLEAVNAVVFGPAAVAERVGVAVRRVHDRVTGPGYAANDPTHLAWVQATLTDTVLWAYEAVIGRLDDDDADELCRQMATVGEVFGCPLDAQPSSRAELGAYVDEMVGSFPVDEVCRRVAADVVSPRLALPLRLPLAPVLAAHGLVTVGATPPLVRELLGLRWDRPRQLLFAQAVGAARVAARVAPRPVRLAPGALQDRFFMARTRRRIA